MTGSTMQQMAVPSMLSFRLVLTPDDSTATPKADPTSTIL